MADLLLETGTQPRVKYNEQGLIPAIVQDESTGAVLMMAWMNDAALRHTIETRKATFYSRSRGKMWVKGESSGHVQRVVEARVDCDQDTVLLRVRAEGPACHAGYQSCFYRAFDGPGQLRFVEDKVFDPGTVYRKS
jgi:phosphoribosyl-AMP cyclohydrolase